MHILELQYCTDSPPPPPPSCLVDELLNHQFLCVQVQVHVHVHVHVQVHVQVQVHVHAGVSEQHTNKLWAQDFSEKKTCDKQTHYLPLNTHE